MSCPQCQHCRDLSNPAALTLPRTPQSSPGTGTDLEFYRWFALAYDRARELHLRPRTALLAANPWMTPSQCAAYLKRARSFGMVQAPARRPSTPRPTPPPLEVQDAPLAGRAPRALDWDPARSGDAWFGELHGRMDVTLAAARTTERPVTVDDVRAGNGGKLSAGQARAVLDWVVASGYGRRADDGVSVHPD